jgi:hypothetical protein
MVQPETIQRCWHKSTLIKNQNEEEVVDHEAAERIELQADIAKLPIEDPLPLTDFLCPDDEEVVDDEDDIFASVINHHTISDAAEEELSSDEEEEFGEVYTPEALDCIENLSRWKLQNGNPHDMQALDRIEREVLYHKSASATQTTLDSYFYYYLTAIFKIRIPDHILKDSRPRPYVYVEFQLY